MVHKSRESKRTLHGSRKNRKPVSRGRKNIDSRVMEKISLFKLHAKKKHPFTRDEKSIGDPLVSNSLRLFVTNTF